MKKIFIVEDDYRMREGTPYDAAGMIYSDHIMIGGTPDIVQTLEGVGFNIEPEDKVVLFNTYIVSDNGKEVLSQFAGTSIAQKVVGMHIINNFLVNFGQPSSIGNALITGAILLLIYRGYFIATYS